MLTVELEWIDQFDLKQDRAECIAPKHIPLNILEHDGRTVGSSAFRIRRAHADCALGRIDGEITNVMVVNRRRQIHVRSTSSMQRTTVSRMAMGKRRPRAKQASMWVPTQDLPRSAAHPFYARLNQLLDQHDFDGFVEGLCERFYAEEGRPGLPPGRYFRLLLIGYFEGLDAERAIAWRAADSFALREFLGLVLPEAPPDHSTISRTRRLIELETHEAVFTWMLERLADAGLVKGKTVGIDATTLEANAALRSIVRRDTGESYQDFLTKLAQASGIETPTRADLARVDRKRKKKGSNDDWTHPHDPDAKITKMKD